MAQARTILNLSRMSGLLALHLALEDRVMHPRLQAQSSYAVVEASRRNSAEVGGFKEDFGAYKKKWLRPAAIESAWVDFAGETRTILRGLRETRRLPYAA